MWLCVSFEFQSAVFVWICVSFEFQPALFVWICVSFEFQPALFVLFLVFLLLVLSSSLLLSLLLLLKEGSLHEIVDVYNFQSIMCLSPSRGKPKSGFSRMIEIVSDASMTLNSHSLSLHIILILYSRIA